MIELFSKIQSSDLTNASEDLSKLSIFYKCNKDMTTFEGSLN